MSKFAWREYQKTLGTAWEISGLNITWRSNSM